MTRPAIYRGMTRDALDAAYDNSKAVAESPAILDDWNARSDALAAAHPAHLDLRYGPRERNRVDYFPAGAGAPVLVFVHGGYWQMRAKETFRFLAAGPLAHSVSVALIAYTLAPDATLREIVAEVDAALTFIAGNVEQWGGNPARVFVSGWSAGGHLAAMSLAHPVVRGGIAISGIYDLEPIRLCFLDDRLQLTDDDVERLSPLRRVPGVSPPLAVVYGTAELPELQRQSRDYAAAREAAGLPVRLAPLSGRNHFTILEELAHPSGAITALVRELVGA
jgi:acetyl esterase/lipase